MTGKAIAKRIANEDGSPMGIARLWSWWKSPTGVTIHSFTMLTINADKHELMRNFHKPTDKKRMVVILPVDAYEP
jgi:putative SOS response-associated peptidase YedK